MTKTTVTKGSGFAEHEGQCPFESYEEYLRFLIYGYNPKGLAFRKCDYCPKYDECDYENWKTFKNVTKLLWTEIVALHKRKRDKNSKIEEKNTFDKKIGFRDGKVIIKLATGEIEITPDEIQFNAGYDYCKKENYLKVQATLITTPELKQALQELILSRVVYKSVLTTAEEKGQIRYGVIVHGITEEEFSTFSTL